MIGSVGKFPHFRNFSSVTRLYRQIIHSESFQILVQRLETRINDLTSHDG